MLFGYSCTYGIINTDESEYIKREEKKIWMTKIREKCH